MALREIFKPNLAITNPILVDNKEERKREETRPHKKPRYKGGFPKEIKMCEILMPPNYWHKMGEDSTLDPRQSGLVEEITHKQKPTTSTQIHQQPNLSTLDPHQSGLVEERPNKQTACTSTHTNQQQGDLSTLDSRRSELVEERISQYQQPRDRQQEKNKIDRTQNTFVLN